MLLFFFILTAPTEIYTLSLHDALPICRPARARTFAVASGPGLPGAEEEAQAVADIHDTTCPPHATVDDVLRSEEHTSELQSHVNLVCRLLLEKKNTTSTHPRATHLHRS